MKRVIFIFLIAILSLTSITACEPAKFEVILLSVTPQEVKSGEPITIEASISNTGGSNGIYTANLMVDGEIIETRDIPIDATDTKTAQYVIVLDDIGVHKIAIGNVVRSIKVVIDTESIVGKTLDASQKVKTCTFDMSMKINTIIASADSSKVMRIKLDGVFDIDNVAKKMKAIIDVVMEEVGVEVEQATLELYVLDNKRYTKLDQPGIPSHWQVEDVSAGTWESMHYWEHHVDLLQKSEIELLGTEKVNNIDCYAVQLSPDMAEFLKMMLAEQQLGQQFSEEEIDIVTTMLSSLFVRFMDISAKEWIDKDTHLPRKTEMIMDIYISPDEFMELGLIILAGYEFTLGTNINLVMESYNEPLSIVLPPEAQEANPATIND
ncbi:hypothetical protein ES703_80339 [subsurface metagenome]